MPEDPYVYEVTDVSHSVIIARHPGNDRHIHEWYVEYQTTVGFEADRWFILDENALWGVTTSGAMVHSYASVGDARAAIKRHAAAWLRTAIHREPGVEAAMADLPAELQVNYQIIRQHIMIEPQSTVRVIVRNQPEPPVPPRETIIKE